MRNPFHYALPLIASLLILGSLTACGQKGDLYLPDKSEPAQNQG